MSFRRKQRAFQDVEQDANFPYYVGRLLGASEMISHWLTLQEDKEAQELGKRLGVVVGWFLTDEPEEIPTQIIPPKS